MFSIFRKLFAKKEATAVAKAPAPAPAAAANMESHTAPVRTPHAAASSASTQPKPQVAVAQLSLAAIINKFPADLRGNILNMPEADATVALPLATINKQLATGAVKMSLASLYRQAPRGVFREARSEDKRMVEVPLSEVMRHVDVAALRRRTDQRRVDLPKGAPQLFGDRQNPFAIAPSFADEEDENEPVDEAPEPEEEEDSVPEPAPVLRMPAFAPAAATVAAPADAGGTLDLRLADLCGAWPEPIRSEAMRLGEESTVALPTATLAAGLAKGKVAFNWGQIRSWITPTPAPEGEGRDGTELLLPLKIVAPAFMAHSRPAARRKTVDVDDSIPALFGGTQAEPAPAAEPEPVPAAETDAALPPPAIAPAPALKFVLSEEPVAAAAPVVEPEPAPVAAAPLKMAEAPALSMAPAVSPSSAQTLGELFGKPEQKSWPAQELIERTAKLPGVAGAALALQEGMLVAAVLPEEMKGDTVAAFLPQMFARLNNYAGEMKLGTVEDMLLSTNGAHFQAYKMGQVYFAVLGQPGTALPWEALQLVVKELQSQSPE